MKRFDWDEYFMNIAFATALRSTCPRRSVGAVLVGGNRITGSGYNGAPSGCVHCLDAGCQMVDNHCVRTIHAEVNALLCAGVTAYSLVLDTVMYCTDFPCHSCAKAIVASGVKRVVYAREYESTLTWNLFTEAGIRMDFMSDFDFSQFSVGRRKTE